MSLFSIKKPSRRNFRRRQIEAEEEEEEGGETGEAGKEGDGDEGDSQPQAATTSGSKQVDKETKAAVQAPRGGSGVLSFGDELEEEGLEFKVKKSSHSRRMARLRGRERKGGPKEKRGTAGSPRPGSQAGSEPSSQPGSQPTSRHESSEESEDDTSSSLTHRLSAGYIPDATTIHAVRKKRELARQKGGRSDDYIPLENAQRASTKVARGKSRLVREDDNDKSDSDPETEARMQFGKKQDVSRQMQVLNALENVESDSDEEMQRWEEEQINKGANFTIPTSSESQTHQPLTFPPDPLSAIDQSFLYGSSSYPGGDPSATYPLCPPDPYASAGPYGAYQGAPSSYGSANTSHAVRPLIPNKLVPITVDSLKSRLQTHLRELSETHTGHERRLEQIESDLHTSQREIEQAEGRSVDVSREYQFFQEIKGYLRDLLSCLAEKAPEISQLRVSLQEVLRQRAELLVERRRQDVQDQAHECTQGNNAGKQNGFSSVEEARKRRSIEREARRRRRRERREKEAAGGRGHYDGLSSDDELLESNRLKFVNEMKEVSGKGKLVFEDVVEDFCRVSLIKERFEEWKFSFSDSYQQAFISLCLPKVFAPLVQLQMVDWNPLQADCPDFESMSWFEILMFFGYREGEEPDPDDEDLQLIPRLVAKVVVPRIAGLLQHVWDPLSTSQTQRVVALIRRLAEDYPTVSAENKETQEMFTAALLRMRQSIDNDVYIPLFTAVQLENSLSAKYCFYQRQFWSCVKLLGNITEWAGLLAPDTLQELVLDGLVNRYLLLSLQNSPTSPLSVSKAETIISKLPPSWFSEGSTVTRPLQGMARYLTHLAELLHRASITSPDHEKKKTRLAIQKIAKLLVKMQAHTDALVVATENKLNDVLEALKSR